VVREGLYLPHLSSEMWGTPPPVNTSDLEP